MTIAIGGLHSYPMLVRLRLPELLRQHHMTPYELAKRAGGRISMSTAYRIVRADGRVQNFDADFLEALCDVFGVGVAELLEREPRRRGR